MAIRIVVDNVRDCYAALGCIHANWKPVVGRFKDYIAMPKFNLYQSLHTTVIGPQGKPIEVQIRSRDMHRRAEWGVASHWSYKEGGADADWLDRIIDWQDDVSDPRQFLESLKTDLERDEVFAFTPKGKVIALPVGSTPVDFAYSVHTEIGHRCVGARVNGRLVPLETRLTSGDTCEILTSSDDEDGPREDWLEFVVSPKATSKIRQWMARERNEDLLDAGRDELVAEVARLGVNPDDVLSSPALDDEATSMNYVDRTSLYRAIGEGHVAAAQVASRVVRLVEAEDATVPSRAVAPVSASGIRVEGMDAAAVRIAECCAPLLGDDLLSLHTGGADVVVHRADCPAGIAAVVEGYGKVVDADWAGALVGPAVTAVVEVVAIDRSKLLRDVANALSEEHVNIVACSTHTGNDRVARMRFEFELADPSHLKSVLRTIRRIDSVYDAYRIGSIGAVTQ
jgi:GTP pyrophosphokinase